MLYVTSLVPLYLITGRVNLFLQIREAVNEKDFFRMVPYTFIAFSFSDLFYI